MGFFAIKGVMRIYLITVVLFLAFVFHGCGESPLDSRYMVKLPALPQAWKSMLGDPHWQAEWINDKGRKETMSVRDSGAFEVLVSQTLVSAVSAAPFWPEKGIGPGIFKPAGAIFPFDASGNTISLSWQGGVDAVLYRELARFAADAGSADDGLTETDNAARAVTPRLPQNFNWPRFRLLFNDPSLNAEVRTDPWLADWSGIAVKIIQSGFDKRRLVPETRSSLKVPANPGPWAGSSPFAAPLFFDGIPVFPVRLTADTWVCAEGLLRCNTETWIFIEMSNEQ